MDFDACLDILNNAQNDKEIFAGLMMLTKSLSSVSCDESRTYQLFDAIGERFVIKLMMADTGDESLINPYHSVAVAILSTFCADPKLVEKPEIISTLPHLLRILDKASKIDSVPVQDSDSTGTQSLINDCFDCLTCIVGVQSNRSALVSFEVPEVLCRILERKSHGWQKALELLQFLIGDLGSALWRGRGTSLELLLNFVSAEFKNDQSERKFELCSVLADFLTSIDSEEQPELLLASSWKLNIYETVFILLRHRLDMSHRLPVLQLTSVFVEVVGVAWCVSQSPDGIKFMLLTVNMACIEMRLALEEKSFNEIVSSSSLLIACYRLLEAFIPLIYSETTPELDDRQLKQIHAAIVGAGNSATTLFQKYDSEASNADNRGELHNVILASVRVIGRWLAVDSNLAAAEVSNLLPLLFKVSLSLHRAYEAQQLTMMTTNADSLVVRVEATDVVHFLLPCLSHLSSEGATCKILIDNGGHTLMLHYLQFRWQLAVNSSFAGGENEELLLAVLSIYLNVAICQRLMTVDAGFDELLKVIVTCLPMWTAQFVQCGEKANTELAYTRLDQVDITFKLCLLGLLLLRHVKPLSANDVISESACKSFLTATITVFRGVHALSIQSNKKCRLIVTRGCQLLDGVIELWTFGMHVLALLVKEQAWAMAGVHESGWTADIIVLLKQCQVDKSIVDVIDAYDDVLAACATGSASLRKQLLDNGASSVAGTFSMAALQAALSASA